MRNSRNVQAGAIVSPVTFRSDVSRRGITVERLSDRLLPRAEEGGEIFAAIGVVKRDFSMKREARSFFESEESCDF